MTKSLLIDTCALLWLASSPDRISPDVRRRIAESDIRYVSSMTYWEIIFKCRIGKLKLGLDPIVWLERVEKKFGLTAISVSHEAMITAASLSLHHRDPADRFIIATALKMQLPVVTSDDNFPKYNVVTVWRIQIRPSHTLRGASFCFLLRPERGNFHENIMRNVLVETGAKNRGCISAKGTTGGACTAGWRRLAATGRAFRGNAPTRVRGLAAPVTAERSAIAPASP